VNLYTVIPFFIKNAEVLSQYGEFKSMSHIYSGGFCLHFCTLPLPIWYLSQNYVVFSGLFGDNQSLLVSIGLHYTDNKLCVTWTASFVSCLLYSVYIVVWTYNAVEDWLVFLGGSNVGTAFQRSPRHCHIRWF